MTRFGRHMLEHWSFDPEITYLNHGTVGAPPRRVLTAQQRIRDEIERQPSRFMLRELVELGLGAAPTPRPKLRAAAGVVAEFLSAQGGDLVFVENATTGVNAVLRSLDLRKGDEILVTDHSYGAIANAAAFAARERGAHVKTVELPYPVRDSGEVVDVVASALGRRTRLLLVDHITSESALVLPLAEIASRCHRKGVPVLVDGAHAPGAIPFDLPALGVDWYAGNLHKWAYAPRNCGFLWAAPDRQAHLHPTVISWGLDKGFLTEFDWVGTLDPSGYLAAPEAIAVMREFGLDALCSYNHALAWEAARHLSSRWGTKLGMGEVMVGAMATVPLPERMGSTPKDAARVRDALLFEDRIEVQLHAWRGRLWVRVSAQVYNDMSDVERLAAAVAARA